MMHNDFAQSNYTNIIVHHHPFMGTMTHLRDGDTLMLLAGDVGSLMLIFD